MLESIIVPLILIAITYTATVWLQQHHSRKKATESETTVETRDYEGEIKKLNEEKLELEKKLSQREKKFEKNSVEFSVYREEKEQNEKLNETVQQRLKKQIAAFELQTKQQSKEVEKLRSLLEEKNGELNRMRDQLQQTEVELKQARRAVNEQQKEHTSRIKQHDTTIDNLKKQIALNEKQVKKAIQQQKEYDEMNNHIVYLENQLKVKDQDIEMDKQTIHELRHEIDSYETKFGPESDNSYVSEEIDELKTQVENLQNSVLQMKDDIRLKEERVVALEEEVKSRDIEIEKGNQLLNELRSSYEQQMSEMEDRLTAVPEDQNTINNLVQLHNEELSELRSRMQLAIDQEKEKLEQIAEELFFKDQHIKEYKDIVDQFKTEIENERTARSEMKSKMDDDIEQLKHLYTDKIDQLQHEKSVLESNIMKHVNHLEFRNTELLRKLDEIDSARIKERYEIEKERRDIEDEREKLFTDRTSKINELQKRISQEETDHKKANAYAEYLHKALKQKNEEISDLRQQVHKLLNASKSGTNTPRNVQTIDSGYANSKVLEEIMLRPQINIPPATNAISPRVAAKQEEQHSINDHKKISTV